MTSTRLPTAMRPVEFRPPRLLRNPHVQSVLASSAIRRWRFRHGQRAFERASHEVLLDCGEGIRLQGFHTRARTQEHGAPRGLVVLLHGWEGSAQSSYILNVGARLISEGYDVFRLNFRDHGESHHLNREIFHSCRILEVVGAVRDVSVRFAERPLALAGFSLGGNFALRVALRAPAHRIPLARVVAICPAIRPTSVLTAIEAAPWFYHAYFMKKWRSSLQRKQALFPDAYVFEPRFLNQRMRELTAELIERYTEFGSLDNYLDGYSIHDDRLATLAVPTSILTSEDDPIIPIADFRSLQLPDQVDLHVAPHGGHCGFIRDWSLQSYAEDFLITQLGGMPRAA
jgi:predicted alpha/beta-fold hydrolase